MIDIINDHFCIYCGLPQTLEPGISGCSGETSTDHNFVDPADKPFRDWDTLRLRRRVNRAIVKARSSRAMVLHTQACPAPGWGVDILYSEKFVKRTNLAAQGMVELIARGVIKVTGSVDAELIAGLLMKQIDDSLADKDAPLVNITEIASALVN